MISNEEYQKITKDIAESRTKSRFTYEIAHGVNMIYEEYKKNSDFFIIFDYSCDIEKGANDKISFYQIKTKTSGSYTIDILLKSNSSKKSILQTLVDLKSTNSVDGLYIVSNKPLTGENFTKPISNAECIPFALLTDDTKNKINAKIKWPLGISDFDNLFFCVSNIIVKEADNSLIGLTDKFLNSIFPSTFTNPSSFKTSIMSLAREKADYEYDTLTLEETIMKKGITKADVDRLLNDYRKAILQSVIPPSEKIAYWIDKLSLNMAIAIKIKSIYIYMCNKAYLNEKEQEIIKMINNLYTNKYGKLQPVDAIKEVVSNFPNNDWIIQIEEKYLYAIIAYERGAD